MVAHDEPFESAYMFDRLTKKLPQYDVALFTTEGTTLGEREFEWNANHLKELYYLRISMQINKKLESAILERKLNLIPKLGRAFESAREYVFRTNGNVDFFAKAVDAINSPVEYVPTSFPTLRKLIGGYTRKQISSIGGKSGHNKTTFALFDAVEQLKLGYAERILYVSVDEDGEMVARRVLASQLGIPLSAMRNKEIQLNSTEIHKAISKILGNRLIIIDNLLDAESISASILDLKPDRVIIDHIQELNYGKEGISDAKLMVAAGQFKQAAKAVNANVTILSQVRDKLIDERYDSKVPRPHDFLYASDLRRKSREQCVVYWGYKDSQIPVEMPFFDFIVWKSTYSETGKVKFSIDPDKAVFYDVKAGQGVGIAKAIVEKQESKQSSIWEDLHG